MSDIVPERSDFPSIHSITALPCRSTVPVTDTNCSKKFDYTFVHNFFSTCLHNIVIVFR